jgi:hypothetical protein
MTKPVFFAIGQKYLEMEGLTDNVLPWEDGLRASTDPGTFE